VNPTIDFGVWQPMAIGDLVWWDANQDGRLDQGELRFPGVSVVLLVSTTLGLQPVATTTTNADGRYVFTGLVPGTYVVLLPTTNFTGGGALVSFAVTGGYESGTTNVDEYNTASSNGLTFGTLGSGGYVTSALIVLAAGTEPTNDTGLAGTGSLDVPPLHANGNTNMTIDFGFYQMPTAIQMAWVNAQRNQNGTVTVGWQSVLEPNTLGYQVYRVTGANASGTLPAGATQVSVGLIAATGAGTYGFTDVTTEAGVSYTYYVVEVDLNGTATAYGPALAPAPAPVSNKTVFLPLVTGAP